jgi:hypothetical protein
MQDEQHHQRQDSPMIILCFFPPLNSLPKHSRKQKLTSLADEGDSLDMLIDGKNVQNMVNLKLAI